MSRVAAIVPTKNRSAQLRQALASIRALEGDDLTFELIVVDNGSTDDTEQVAREFNAVVLRTLTPGAAAARNTGLRHATSEYVAFLDDDDVWLPGHIRPQLALLEQQPELGAVIGQIVLTDYQLRNFAPAYPTRVPSSGDLFTFFLGYIHQVGATVARTSVRETVGYFDSDYEGDEDWDWHLRLALRHRVGFVEVPCMLFRQRPIGATADQHWQRVRNTRRVFFKNLRRGGFLRFNRRALAPLLAVRQFLSHNGYYFAYFAAQARQQHTAGDDRGALTSLVRAFLSSPVHTILELGRSDLARVAVGALSGAARAGAWQTT